MALEDVVAELRDLADRTNSFGYRFCYRRDHPEFDEHGIDPDAPLVQVYVRGDGKVSRTACDRAGRPLGHTVAGNEGVPYHRRDVAPDRRQGERRKGERRRGWFRR